jgi:plasmid stabilization system protein ParE
VIADLHQAFRRLADSPGIGHMREDLTSREVLFWPLHSYLIVYRDSNPLRIVRIIHGKRDVKKILKKG